MATATMPSSHQWLAVTTTAQQVSTGWAMTSQRHRLVLATMAANATSTAHPTCSEGMADIWLAAPVPNWVYTDCPYRWPVSTNSGRKRGGITATSCMTRQAAVSRASVLRMGG